MFSLTEGNGHVYASHRFVMRGLEEGCQIVLY